MKINNKYRTFDYSTNVIISTKIGVQGYAPYKSVKQQSEIQSYKKIDSQNTQHQNVNINVKMFDKNKRQPKILSRNDRNDLFLEGGKAIDYINSNNHRLNINTMLYAMNKANMNEQQKNKTLQKFFKDRNYFRVSRQQNNSETQIDFNSKSPTINQNKNNSQQVRSFSRASTRQITSKVSQRDQQNVMIKQIAQQARKQSRDSCRKSLINFVSTQSEQCKIIAKKPQSTTIKYVSNKKKNNMIKNSNKNPEKLKIQTKQTTSTENFIKMEKVKRPLYYLQPKQISNIKAQNFIVTEYPSGNIIIGNYHRKVNQIASLTKIMTFYTVYKLAQKYQKDVYKTTVQIDEQAESMTGTSAQIVAGDVYTIQQLLYGLMLPSGNDAAVALAKWGGSLIQQQQSPKTPGQKNQTPQKKFINQMNKYAKQLNMKNTRFTNPHGLPNQMSGSTPEQMAILLAQCLSFQLFKTVIKTKQYRCWVEHKGVNHQVVWQNTNKLLRRPNFIGGKTGVTISAGPCLASCYQFNEKILIVVLLKTNKLSRRFKQTRMILALALSKLGSKENRARIRQIMKNDADLDSDNSQDQQQFCYDRSDARQMAKRNKILTYQM